MAFLERCALVYFCFLFLYIEYSNQQVPGRSKAALENMLVSICRKFKSNIAYRPEGIEEMRDVLPEICGYLNIHDLCSLRVVCKNFKGAADEEEFHRGPEVHVLSLAVQGNNDPWNKPTYILGIKPRIALFLTNQNPVSPLLYDSASKELISHYAHELPKTCPIIHLIGARILIKDQEITVQSNKVLGLFFHETPRVTIREGTNKLRHFNHQQSVTSMAQEFWRKSFPKKWKESVDVSSFAYILFNFQIPKLREEVQRKYAESITDKIKHRATKYPGKFALWGGKTFAMASNIINDFPASFGMSISGPGTQSWSLIIDINKSETEIEQKIMDFKKVILLKPKKTVVLSLQSVSLTDSQGSTSKTNLFSKKFPELQLVTFGIRPTDPKYCIDSWVKVEENAPYNPQVEYEGENWICYLIITYI